MEKVRYDTYINRKTAPAVSESRQMSGQKMKCSFKFTGGFIMRQKLIRATALTMSMLMLGATALTGCSNQEEGKTTTSSATEASTAKDTETGTQVSSSETGNKA